MPVVIEISVSENLEAEEGDIPDTTAIQRWAEQACLRDDELVTSVQVVSIEEMRELNHTWRGKDRPTNVLSFPMQSPAEVRPAILGDLALCAGVINAEARQQHKSAEAHWAHMVVHGMLHLQGYDHETDREADEMEALEIRLLDQLGFDNPYRQPDVRQTLQ